MSCKKEQLIRNLPEHHLVVRPEDGHFTVLSYARNQQLTTTITQQQMKDFMWFQTPESLFNYIEDEENSLSIEENKLVIHFKIGKKQKYVSVEMKEVEMDELKEVKMTLKRVSFELKKNMERIAECLMRIQEKQKQREALKQQIRQINKQTHMLSRDHIASQRTVNRMREGYNAMEANLTELTDIYDVYASKLKLLNGEV